MNQTQQQKLPVLWIDATLSKETQGAGADFLECFDVQSARVGEAVGPAIVKRPPAAVFIDYDYPDRRGLRFAANLKAIYPSLPMFVLMVQHSEELATWAFRSGMSDYLVKPVSSSDINRVTHAIREIWHLRQQQPARDARNVVPSMPAEARMSDRHGGTSLLPAIYLVRKRYRDKIRLEDAAGCCGIKASVFSRLFHETYGLTFRDYLVRYRLREAKRLLRDPRVSISEVAETVGFNDMSYFSRMFKRHFGLPPSIMHGQPAMPAADGGSTTRMLRLPVIN